MDYYSVYEKRVNRYGDTYQSRIQGERESNFDYYLKRSVYRVTFSYDDKTIVGSLEKFQQNETKTLQYLLTHLDVNIPNGAILSIVDADGTHNTWMVYYVEHITSSGYNRYVLIRMSHFLEWQDENGEHSSWAYFYGQQNNMLKDEIRSRSRTGTIYAENLKSSFFIMPLNQYIKKDTYFEIGQEPFKQSFRVTGYDLVSSEGCMYVTVDPIYEYDHSLPPEQTGAESGEDFFWFNGGVTNE